MKILLTCFERNDRLKTTRQALRKRLFHSSSFHPYRQKPAARNQENHNNIHKRNKNHEAWICQRNFAGSIV